jgi:hypothetical protein
VSAANPRLDLRIRHSGGVLGVALDPDWVIIEDFGRCRGADGRKADDAKASAAAAVCFMERRVDFCEEACPTLCRIQRGA